MPPTPSEAPLTARHASGRAGVASGHPRATEAGLRALRDGGSIADAALAAAITQWVVNAPLCGPGGDLVALVRRGGKTTVYGGWSRVPLGIDVEARPEASGPRGAVVPGGLRGAQALHRDHGRLGWDRLFDDAIEAAAGHEITPRMESVYGLVWARGHGEAGRRILGLDEPPSAGARVRLDPLAGSLARIARDGADILYTGELADRVVDASRADGGWLAAADLAGMEAAVEPARRFELPDLTVWVPGLPSQAQITPALLAAADESVAPTSVEFAEATAPLTEELLVQRSVQGLAGTAASTAGDATGTSVTIVHSLAGVQFGTGWVAADTGIALGNRTGTALSTRPDLPASNPRPGAVLPHTLSAAHVRRGDHWMTVATPGGDRQVQWLAQAIQRFRLGVDPAETAAGPRWFVCPEGDRFGVPGGIGRPWFMFAEPGVDWRERDRVSGYDVRPVDNVGGGLQLVVGSEGDAVELASDPRAGGGAGAL